MKLSALNPSKAHGSDGIPAWLLKENADLLAGPVSAILNSSFHESLEYASPVFHRSLSNYISEDLERIQRRAFRIIYPDLSYSVALETVGLPKLHERSRGGVNVFPQCIAIVFLPRWRSFPSHVVFLRCFVCHFYRVRILTRGK